MAFKLFVFSSGITGMTFIFYNRTLKLIFPFTLMWLIAGWSYMLIERGIMGDSLAYPSTGNAYDFLGSFIAVTFTGLLMGTIQGIVEATVFRNSFKRYSFGLKLLFKTLFYFTSIFVAIMLFSFPLNSVNLEKPLFHPEVVDSVFAFVSNFVFWSIMIYASTFTAITLFVVELMNNLGSNVVINFFTGRYHASKEEERVFMFLDMKGSTTIAEKLGHQQYYKLLNAYYEDMTEAILKTRGEIYQYVGDEIIVSWPFERGIEKANCLRCFYLIKAAIAAHTQRYEESFGHVPEFKAGLHYGTITTGEVGVIKKELLFTGDVLNTTARVQSLCNELQVDLLISSDLQADLSHFSAYHYKPKGEYELRGRDQKIELFTVSVD